MASTPQIKIGVGIDGKGISVAEGLLNAMFNRIGGKGKEVFHTLKEGIASMGGQGGVMGAAAAFGAISGASMLLYELGTHTAHWAHEIEEVSGQMGISTDAAQTLSLAAELMGKDLEWAAQMMVKEELVLEKALGGQSKFRKLTNEIGIGVEELSKINPEEAHEKFMAAVAAGKISDAEIGRIYGVKQIRHIKSLAESEDYAKDYGFKLDKDVISMMADEYRAWKLILKDFGVVLAFLGAILVQVVRIIRKTFVSEIEIMGGAILGLVSLILKAASKIPGLGYLGKTANEYGAWSKSLAVQAGDDIRDIAGPKGKKKDEATTREGDKATTHLEKLEGNPFLKIGGLVGVDTNFRIERLTQQMVKHLDSIDHKMNAGTTQKVTPPHQSTIADYAAYSQTPSGKGIITGIRAGLGI